jgi:fatty acid desaturase
VGIENDPDYELYGEYRTRKGVLWGFLGDLLGISAVLRFVRRYRTRYQVRQPWYSLFGLLAVQASIWAVYYFVTGWVFGYVFLWLFPLMTIPIAIDRLRTMVEHLPPAGHSTVSRSTLCGLLEYCLIAPYGYSYHYEHHLLSSIPYYHLERAHRHLQEQGVVFTGNQVSPRGYVATFIRLMKQLGTNRGSGSFSPSG